MKTKRELQSMTNNGYTWAYDEAGAHFFYKCLAPNTQDRFAMIRCLPEDLENGNFEFFAKHGLTNTNKAKPVRLYHIVAINEKSGAKTYQTRYPMTHAECCTMKSKFTPHAAVRIQLEEVTA